MSALAINGGRKAVSKQETRDPLYEKMINEECDRITGMLRANDISAGSPEVAKLEEEWAGYLGRRYCVAQNNGTSTLHAAYFAAGVEPGDEVITPVFTWHLGVTPILASHGIPVFCDCDPLTLNIDPAKIEEKVTPRTKAVVVTHIYGHPVDMDPVLEIARRHSLAVIEDASHAHGAEYKGRKIGSLGDIACFSIQGTKLMAGGEGGLLVTDNREYYERTIMLGHFERMNKLVSEKHTRYRASENVPPMHLGFKYRIHPFAAGMARVQFKYLEQRNELERKNCAYIARGLAGMKGFDPPHIAPYAGKVTWLNQLARFHPDAFEGVPREKVIRALQAEGVAAGTGRTGYIPLHLHPLMRDQDMYGKGCPWKCRHAVPREPCKAGDFPVAEKVYRERIMIPTFRDVVHDPELLDQYIEAFRKVADNLDELSP